MENKPNATAMEERLQNLEALRQRILEMPSKVSYEQMIPLSKVAFCPGKLIHTNEFKIPDEHDTNPNLDKIDYISYIEAAEKLKNRINGLEQRVEEERKQSTSASIISKTEHQENATKSYFPDNNTSTATDQPYTGNPIHNSKVSKKQTDSTATDNENSPKNNRSRVFEIREYLDDESGESANTAIPVKHEVTDITEQIERMEKFTSKPEGRIPSSSYLNDDETEFLKELAEITAAGQDNIDFDEEHNTFDSSCSGKARQFENLDEMFARIEAQQQRQEELQQKMAKKQKEKAASGGNSGGWKSGFLSGGKASSKKGASKNDSVVSLSIQATESLPTSKPPVTSTQEDTDSSRRVQFRSHDDVLEIENREQLEKRIKEMSIEERKAEREALRAKEIADAEAAIKAEEAATGKPRPPPKKPFTGMILEKFP